MEETNMVDLPLSERLSGANPDTLREIIREAELHLQCQQTVALAADQRAMTFIGFLSAIVVVLIGASTSFAIGTSPNVALAVVSLMVAAGLLSSVLWAMRAAAPSDFDFAGSSPSDWIDDVAAGDTLERALAMQCQHYAESIDDNHKRMKTNSDRLWLALRLAVGTLAVGGVAFILTLALS